MIKSNPQILRLSEQLNYIANVGLNLEGLVVLIARQLNALNEEDITEVLNTIGVVIETYLAERNDDA